MNLLLHDEFSAGGSENTLVVDHDQLCSMMSRPNLERRQGRVMHQYSSTSSVVMSCYGRRTFPKWD